MAKFFEEADFVKANQSSELYTMNSIIECGYMYRGPLPQYELVANNAYVKEIIPTELLGFGKAGEINTVISTNSFLFYTKPHHKFLVYSYGTLVNRVIKGENLTVYVGKMLENFPKSDKLVHNENDYYFALDTNSGAFLDGFFEPKNNKVHNIGPSMDIKFSNNASDDETLSAFGKAIKSISLVDGYGHIRPLKQGEIPSKDHWFTVAGTVLDDTLAEKLKAYMAQQHRAFKK